MSVLSTTSMPSSPEPRTILFAAHAAVEARNVLILLASSAKAISYSEAMMCG